MVIKNQWLDIPLGISFGLIECAGVRFYILYKTGEKYGAAYISSYFGQYYRMHCNNGSFYYISDTSPSNKL